jgi:hypothetical protein
MRGVPETYLDILADVVNTFVLSSAALKDRV